MLRANEKGDRHFICPPFIISRLYGLPYSYTLQFRMITVVSSPSGTSGWELISAKPSWCNSEGRGTTATTALEGGFYSNRASRAYTGRQSLVLFRNVDDRSDSSI
jgi:hypothetical protein